MQHSPSQQQRAARTTADRQDAGSRQTWLDAWSDPVADVRAYSSCVHTCNLMGDGDWRLVVADAAKKLKARSESTLGACGPRGYQ